MTMLLRCVSYLLVAVSALEQAQAYSSLQSSNNQAQTPPQTSRRNVLATAAAAGASLLLGTRDAAVAADVVDPLTPLYFGVGVRMTALGNGVVSSFLCLDQTHGVSFCFHPFTPIHSAFGISR
jgi:hypothetical protein